MKKVTKKAKEQFLKEKLKSDDAWAKRALIRIFEFQTTDEKVAEHTKDHNGVGFTGFDGELLTSFAKQLNRRGYLSERQMDVLRGKMPKYWRQLVAISDQQKLDSMVLNYLNN